MRIYVAHRYNCKAWNGEITEILASIGRAIDVGAELMKLGHFPFVPHLDCMLAMRMHSQKLPEQFYKDMNMAWLSKCDGIFIVDSEDLEKSGGVRTEFDWALKHGLTPFYSLSEVKDNSQTFRSEKKEPT